MVLSRTDTVILGKWPRSEVSRSPEGKLIMPSNSRHITSYRCFIVTTGLSRTETLFFSRWPWSGLPWSPKVKLIMPTDSRHITSHTCSIVTIAQSRTETLFSADDLDLSKLLKTFLFDKWLLHERICSSCINLRIVQNNKNNNNNNLAFLGHQRSNWLCHRIRDISLLIRVL